MYNQSKNNGLLLGYAKEYMMDYPKKRFFQGYSHNKIMQDSEKDLLNNFVWYIMHLRRLLMTDYDNLLSDTNRIKFEKFSDLDDTYFGQRKNVTAVHGYYDNGQLSFFASYDKDNNYRITFYQEGKEPRSHETFYSDMDEGMALLPKGNQKKYYDAKLFIQKLQTLEKQQNTSFQPKTLAESLKNGIDVSLSPESRLSFAPNIEKLTISKDKDGALHIVGVSNDGKQSVNFSIRDNVASLELIDGKIGKSYNNKFGGSWTYRNINSTSQTRYYDNEGEKYAREFASIMDKLKAAHQQRANTYQNPRSNYSR